MIHGSNRNRKLYNVVLDAQYTSVSPQLYGTDGKANYEPLILGGIHYIRTARIQTNKPCEQKHRAYGLADPLNQFRAFSPLRVSQIA